MDLRVLEPGQLAAVHQTYLEAFSDYTLPVNPPLAAFARLLLRRGADWSRSIGAFDANRLVGLQVTALGTFGFEGTPSAYDVFTGVVPSHRGRGLAGAMFARVLELLRPGEAEQFLLECIQSNEPALSVYRKQGFRVARSFECLEIPCSELRTEATAANVVIHAIASPAWVRFADLRTWEPSWQNSDGSLQRAEPAPHMIGAYRDGELVGYAALFLDRGDLAQFAVREDHRHEGIGSALFAACVRRLPDSVERVRILNVPTDAEGDLAFFASLGAKSFTRQFEMIRPL